MSVFTARFLKSLGPGILFASTCIGVSHLVQSTRAGALYSFGLLWAVVLANVLKYPFFEYGSRYANCTGESIIDGYRRTGIWMLGVYTLITIGSMFFVTAAVGAVTAGFLDNLLGLQVHFPGMPHWLPVSALFLLCIFTLWIGKYKVLDALIKVIGSVLLLSTVAAFVLTLVNGPVYTPQSFFSPEVFDPQKGDFLFLIALMGWMPTALDLSAWNSLWTLERIRQTSYHPTLRETLQEFNFGYWTSALLAPCFLLLGAFLLYGTPTLLPAGAAGFAHTVVQLYVQSMGSWSYLLIAASAFSIMFGTCIAIFDGYARAAQRVLQLFQGLTPGKGPDFYRFILVIVGAGALFILLQLGSSLRKLVDLATTISFLVAPLIAIVNFRLVMSSRVPLSQRPGKLMQWLSYAGIGFLSIFSLVYLWWVL